VIVLAAVFVVGGFVSPFAPAASAAPC